MCLVNSSNYYRLGRLLSGRLKKALFDIFFKRLLISNEPESHKTETLRLIDSKKTLDYVS